MVLGAKLRSVKVAVSCISICLLCFLVQAFGQQSSISTSELAKDNLARVAASQAQIAAVLGANPGLFVELKRWVAKDAADRGQLLGDSDLEDSVRAWEAIRKEQ